jgi:hypothetical protein
MEKGPVMWFSVKSKSTTRLINRAYCFKTSKSDLRLGAAGGPA